MIKLDDSFAYYHVCDSDGNALDAHSGKEGWMCDHPEDALRVAIEAVTRTWQDWECARIIGTISGERFFHDGRADVIDHSPVRYQGPPAQRVKVEETVTVLNVYRDGPPGSRKVRLVHPSFPWMGWTIDADDVKPLTGRGDTR